MRNRLLFAYLSASLRSLRIYAKNFVHKYQNKNERIFVLLSHVILMLLPGYPEGCAGCYLDIQKGVPGVTWISRRMSRVLPGYPEGCAGCYLDIQKGVPGVWSCSISSSLWSGTFTMLLPGYPEGCAGCV